LGQLLVVVGSLIISLRRPQSELIPGLICYGLEVSRMQVRPGIRTSIGRLDISGLYYRSWCS